MSEQYQMGNNHFNKTVKVRVKKTINIPTVSNGASIQSEKEPASSQEFEKQETEEVIFSPTAQTVQGSGEIVAFKGLKGLASLQWSLIPPDNWPKFQDSHYFKRRKRRKHKQLHECHSMKGLHIFYMHYVLFPAMPKNPWSNKFEKLHFYSVWGLFKETRFPFES